MSYTHIPDPRLKPWILELGAEFGGYWQQLLDGASAWNEVAIDERGAARLCRRYLQQWPDIRAANWTRLASTFAHAMREELIAYLSGIGLIVEVIQSHGTITCVAERDFPARLRGCKRDCLNRLGVVYHASVVDEREGVPIYRATIFGRLANAPSGSRSGHAARLALHRDVYVVGRADCSRVTATPDGRHSKFEPIEIEDRLRPNLRKARNTATRVALALPAWEDRLNLIRGRKFARLAEREQDGYGVLPLIEVEETPISEEDAWLIAQQFG